MPKMWDALWINANVATGELGESITNAGLGVKNGSIAWLDKMEALPQAAENLAEVIYDVKGGWITPGLIDCHTHLVYAGNRANEFALRLQGVSYETILQQGGGIRATVKATRAASAEALFAESLKRAKALMKSGVTTVEIKSGYGLDLASEIKILQVAKQIEMTLPLTVYKTFLGAHVVPVEYANRADSYVDYVCAEMIPLIAEEKLADAVDVFCENIAFNLSQTERIFNAAKAHGLAIKCHAEQLSDSGSAALAAHYQALSVDHLEYVSKNSIEALAKANTVAVLLPGAFYFLREKQLPPIDYLRECGVPIAIASDCNPGTSPILSLPLILNMAATLFHLTPNEALTGATKNAAKALGLEKNRGSLAIGKAADLAIWDIKDVAELAYYAPNVSLTKLVKEGKEVVFPGC